MTLIYSLLHAKHSFKCFVGINLFTSFEAEAVIVLFTNEETEAQRGYMNYQISLRLSVAKFGSEPSPSDSRPCMFLNATRTHIMKGHALCRWHVQDCQVKI